LSAGKDLYRVRVLAAREQRGIRNVDRQIEWKHLPAANRTRSSPNAFRGQQIDRPDFVIVAENPPGRALRRSRADRYLVLTRQFWARRRFRPGSWRSSRHRLLGRHLSSRPLGLGFGPWLGFDHPFFGFSGRLCFGLLGRHFLHFGPGSSHRRSSPKRFAVLDDSFITGRIAISRAPRPLRVFRGSRLLPSDCDVILSVCSLLP